MKRFAKLRKFGSYAVLLFLLFLLFVAGFLWYVTTDSFQHMVRSRLVNAIERATGGRAELGSFHVVPLRFQVEVRELTIHGKEPPNELPLVHVDSMSAVVNLSSVLGARIGFHSLTLQHPVVHMIFYPDGTTNQPNPKAGNSTDFTQLFALSIDRLEVHRGEVLWQDQRFPIEFVCNDVSANLNYSFLHQRYAGDLSVGRAETHLAEYRNFAWTGNTSFAINKEGVQVRSLEVSSGDSKLKGDGTISNFRHPVVKGNYELSLDLKRVATIAHEERIKSGAATLKGSGSWSGETYATSGRFQVSDISWQDPTFSGQNLSGEGNYSIDPKTFSLTQLQGKALRGSFTSDVEVTNWQNSGRRLKSTKEWQQGSIKLKLRDISVADFLRGLGPHFRPENKLALTGDASGTMDIRWKGQTSDAEIGANLNVSHSNRASPGQIPLAANAQFVFRANPAVLQITNLSANTPGSQLRASGTLGAGQSMKIFFSTSDLREWQPLTAALFPGGMPLLIRGRGTFNGNTSGSPDNLAVSGNLQIQDFVSLPSTNMPAAVMHWDSLSGDVQVSSHNFAIRNGLLRAADSSVKLEGSAGLDNWSLFSGSGLRFRVDAEKVEASEAGKFIPKNLDLQGKVNAHLEVSGIVGTPTVRGEIDWRQGSVLGHKLDSATSSIDVQGTRAVFKDFVIVKADSRVRGSGAYDFEAQTIQLNVSGNNFDVKELAPLERSRVIVGGKLDFTAEAKGSTAQPDVTAHVHLRSITFNDEIAGDYFVDAATHGDELRLTGRSDFKNAELTINGNVRMRDQWPAEINFHFARLDIDSFLETYLRGHITGHSAVAGDLVLQGPLREPRRLSLNGNLTDLFADIEKVKIRNDGPIAFSVSDEALKIERLHILGENTDFSADGGMQLNGERQMDFHAKGTVNLQVLKTYDPDLTGSGTLKGEARITGSYSAPVVKGKVQVENGAVADINLPSALSDLNGIFLFNQNQVTIDKLTARTGGGTVSFKGRADLYGRQINFDLSAEADSVRLRYPPGVSSTATATLHWTGSSSGSMLSGDITVNKLGVTPGFDFGAYLERAVQSASLPQTDPVLNSIRLDLHVVTAPELQMQTSVLRLRGEAELRVRGNAAKPVLLGRADVFEGEAYFNGTKYRLERGGVTFNNPAVTTPFLDLEATTHVRDYDITLSVNGPADKPKLNYRSEPPLPTNDIIGLLAFGQTTEQSAQLQQTSQSAFSQQASNAMLAAALNATLNNRTQRLFGNSRIKIDPQGLETETSPTQSGPAVTIEQQVKDNLTVTYTTNVAQTSQQIIRAEYNVTRNVSVVAIRDQNGVVSFDVKIRRRKR